VSIFLELIREEVRGRLDELSRTSRPIYTLPKRERGRRGERKVESFVIR